MTSINPPITPKKLEALLEKMKELGIEESDLTEKFIHGSGRGGQKLNKTANCVYLKHEPTGVEVKVQKTRSREMNRFFARRELCEKIEAMVKGEESEREKRQFKINKQKQRRSRRAKLKILEEKSIVSDKKETRKRIDPDEDDG
jgi:protein subunit release factor B